MGFRSSHMAWRRCVCIVWRIYHMVKGAACHITSQNVTFQVQAPFVLGPSFAWNPFTLFPRKTDNHLQSGEHIKDVIIYLKCVLHGSSEFSNRHLREQSFSNERLSVTWPNIVAQHQSSRGSPGEICVFTLNQRNQKMQFSTNSPQSRV